jgi:beta-glucosidase-like glycosyl hydrolase
LFRDPRWGRGQETQGEDPLLSARYVAAFVPGLQGQAATGGEDPRYLQASACCKHYAAYDLENWNGTDRHHFNAIVSDRDMADTYLPAFQACVTQGKVSGIMCSYNEVNGIPSCADSFLLTELLRDTWGFSGYITSDCGAVSDIFYTHQYENSTDATSAVVLDSGMDIGCDGFLPQYLPQALSDGAVHEADLDRALRNLFRVRLRLGHFDAVEQPYLNVAPSAVCTPNHTALSKGAARQGMVLLKNAGNTLPLRTSQVQNLAVVGPNANATGTLLGNYYGTPCFYYTQSVAGGLRTMVPNSLIVPGMANVSDPSTGGFPQALQAVQAADAAVIVVGLDQSQESEGNDRTILSFPGAQEQLVLQGCAATKRAAGKKVPCVVVVMAGGSLDLTAIAASPNVDAILWTGYPGPYGGDAVAETIFGDNVPAGRMVITLYPASFASAVSMFDMGMRPSPTSDWPPFSNPGRTYRFYTGSPVFPFGFGLSYTTFSYSFAATPASTVDLALARKWLATHGGIQGGKYAPLEADILAAYTVTVTNTGLVDADDVVTGFLQPPGAGTNGFPLTQLFGFRRVFVPAGQSVTVFLGLSARDFTQTAEDGSRFVHDGQYVVTFGLRESSSLGMGFAEHHFTGV